MKVLMTADAVGGVWTYAMELARGLEPYGVEIVLAVMGARPRTDQRWEACASGNVELIESDFRLEWMRDPWDDVNRAGEWLLSLAEAHAPDVVHLNGYAHAALSWNAPVMVVGHSCVRSWWTAVRSCSPSEIPAEWSEYTERVRAGLAAADLVVAPTRAMLAELAIHYGPLGATDVIPNGRTLAAPTSLRKERFVLAAGRAWDEGKNLMTLARAASSVDWPVAIAGDITSPDGASLAESHGVQWLGRLSSHELATRMQRASIYALPARYEPFGLSALEAAVAGCALVLGDIASLREVWGDAALFVPPDDSTKLSQTINALCRDESLCRTLSRRARRRSLALTRERMASRYLLGYQRLLRARAPTTEPSCAS